MFPVHIALNIRKKILCFLQSMFKSRDSPAILLSACWTIEPGAGFFGGEVLCR